MEFSGFYLNTKLAAVYYNSGTPPHRFRFRNDATLSGLKDEMDNQPSTQLQRHEEGDRCWISMSIVRLNRISSVQPDETRERRRRENHVLCLWSAQY